MSTAVYRAAAFTVPLHLHLFPKVGIHFPIQFKVQHGTRSRKKNSPFSTALWRVSPLLHTAKRTIQQAKSKSAVWTFRAWLQTSRHSKWIKQGFRKLHWFLVDHWSSFFFATSKAAVALWCGSMLFKVQTEWRDVKLQGASVVYAECCRELQMKGANRVW